MITAIVQARMGSARLPGKPLLSLGNTTVLGSVVRQVQKAKKMGKIIVATSDRAEDDEIASKSARYRVEVFRGSLDDVLDRYYQCAQRFGATDVCRVTADCPLIDPEVIDRVAEEYESSGCDYISTGRVTSTFPDGMDTEIFSFKALERAWREAKLPSEREHVTPYIWKHPELFSIHEVRNERDLSHVRLTLDEPADYEVLKHIVADVQQLSMNAIVEYLEVHPEVAALNQYITRDEGYAKSMNDDAK